MPYLPTLVKGSSTEKRSHDVLTHSSYLYLLAMVTLLTYIYDTLSRILAFFWTSFPHLLSLPYYYCQFGVVLRMTSHFYAQK